MDKIQQNNAKNKKQGKRIRSRMKTLGIRQKDVAERIGASDATVSGWVNGKTSPTKKYLDKLAEQLNVTTDWIENGGYVSKKKIPGKVSDSAPYVQLSTIFKDRTKELKLRQLDIITQVDASRATVSNWFNGKALPNAANMESLSKALDVPLKDLTDAARNDEAEALRKQTATDLEGDGDDADAAAGNDMDLGRDEHYDNVFELNGDDDELESLLRLEAESAELISADGDIHHDESSETEKSNKDFTDAFDKSLSNDLELDAKQEDLASTQGGSTDTTDSAVLSGPEPKNVNDESVVIDIPDNSNQASNNQYHKPKPNPEPDHVEKPTADESANADNAKEQGWITEETTITFTINIVTKKYQS